MTIEKLKQELQLKEDYMQAFHEELEASNEELKCSNEEMQSVNEELQSTNEELETTKEELQSLNEELCTVNTELQAKLLDLSHANNDMNNLLAGTGIATLFLDMHLCVLRFTPSAAEIMNLIPTDIGRPVSHLALNVVNYQNLITDVQAVLNNLIPKRVDVHAKDGKWYAMHIQPYRTLENMIDGAVINFVEITPMVLAQESLRRLATVVLDAHDAITVQDREGRFLAWNPGAERMYGWSEAEALQMNVRDRIPAELLEKELSLIERLSLVDPLKPFPTKRLTKTGTVVDIWMTATALENKDKQIYAIATTERINETGNIPLKPVQDSQHE